MDIKLSPQVKRHDLVFQLPDSYLPELKRAEARINELARLEYARIKADFDKKVAELEAEKALLKQDMATIRDYCHVSITIMHEWYYDQLFMRRLAMELELRKHKATADEKVSAWQETAESLYEDLERHKALVKELKKAKKANTIIGIVERFQ